MKKTVLVLLTFYIACLSRAHESGQSNSIYDSYVRYLQSWGKDVKRAENAERLEAFARSYEFVLDRNEEKPFTRRKYTLALNEYADWTEAEIKLMFHTVPGQDAAPFSPTAYGEIDAANMLIGEGPVRGLKSPQAAGHNGGSSRTSNSISSSDSDSDSNTSISPEIGLPKMPPVPPLNTDDMIYNVHEVEGAAPLNWASDMNPMRKRVTPPVGNQGVCGACWAFVAAAATEASVIINGGDLVDLSAQELIDCDTKFDNGCNGGNPIYAFQYIVEKGLTRNSDYPYIEQSSLKGFMKLKPNSQDSIVEVLPTLGPVAVGVCGTDKDFLFYKGGVFNPPACCAQQNHAMLVVGTGRTADGTEHFVLQNSWGANWGENGFMRMQMTHDNSKGICGVATNPSAAVGGYLMSPPPGKGDAKHYGPRKISIKDQLYLFFQRHWQIVLIACAATLMMLSLALLSFTLYQDYRIYRLRRERKQNQKHAEGGTIGGTNDSVEVELKSSVYPKYGLVDTSEHVINGDGSV